MLSGLHATSVKPYTDLIEGLRKQGIHSDVHLPQIAVLGEQGSGKSSVLDAISGVPFPRGEGGVTRCAIKLVMRGAPKDFSRTTLRPFGPSVVFTASAKIFTPASIP